MCACNSVLLLGIKDKPFPIKCIEIKFISD